MGGKSSSGSARGAGIAGVQAARVKTVEDLAADSVADLFDQYSKLESLDGDIAIADDQVNRTRKSLQQYPGQRDYYEGQVTNAYRRLDELKSTKSSLRTQVTALAKTSKAPGYGEWTSIETGRTMGGNYVKYQHPQHPEWGTVELRTFGGWPMQRVAAHGTVEFRGKSRTWTGQGSQDSARSFLNKIFGVK